jgi:hypothetical protein
MSEHRSDCVFGPGFWRVVLEDGTRRYAQTEQAVREVMSMLGDQVRYVQRDACLDPPDRGDAGTSDVIDAAEWLAMPPPEAMRELNLRSEEDYARAYRMVEEAVIERDRQAAQGGVRASVVIKRPGARVIDVD